jgi:HEAT repeat protein
MCSPNLARIVSAFLATSLVLALHPHAQSRFAVRWSEERLSVHADGAPTESVLTEVARQTNVGIKGIEKALGTSDVDFVAQPLLAALRVLLEDFNYVIVVGHGDPQLTIWIHSRIATSEAAAIPLSERARRTDIGAIHPARQNGEDDRDPEQQEQLEASDRIRDASVETLLDVVRTGNAAARVAALQVLSDRHPKAAAEAARAAVDDPEPAVSGAAMQVLSQIDDPQAIKSIGATLRHPNLAIRTAALELLFLKHDPDSLEYVQPVLNDPSPAFRARARELIRLIEQSSKEKK